MDQTQDKRPSISAAGFLKAAAAVFALALVVRLVYAAQMWQCPLFQNPTMDAGAYYALARRFAEGHWANPSGQPYWQPPFYMYVLAVWFKLAGTSVAAAKNAQLVLGSVNCVLVMLLGWRVLGRRVGIVAGAAMALYGPMVYFDGEILTPTLQVFLNLCAILLLLTASERKSPALFAAAGLILGLSVILRPDVAVFAAGAVVWAALSLRRTEPRPRVALCCALLAAFAALPTLPIMVRNKAVGRDDVLISSNGGLNFYIGNNPREEWTRSIRPGPDWDALQAMPKKDNPDAKPSEQSTWFYRKGIEYATSRPASFAALMVKKTVMYLTAVEGRRNHDLYFHRQYSPLYAALTFKTTWFAFPFGIVLPLAVVGLACRPRGRESALLIWYLAAMLAVTVAFFVCARYRITAVPVLLVFAAHGALELPPIARSRRWVLIGLALAALVVSNANLYHVDRDQRAIEADTRYYLGSILQGRGEAAGAEREFRRSIALNPDYEVSRYQYALLLADQGRDEEARKQLLECLRIDPASPATASKLGEIAEKRGDLPEAIRRYESAARRDAAFTENLVSLAEKAYSRKDYALAERALRGVIAARPDFADARRSLGIVLMKTGRLDEAVETLRDACDLNSDSPDSWHALGLALQKARRQREAQAAFRRAQPAQPSP